mmetsp:Transcript_148126/g.261226  ORF Transcript_148126/g.261226 Transcript_148126/m.261226 type:complete len:814 (+) Transcript_148126:80-2521(+)
MTTESDNDPRLSTVLPQPNGSCTKKSSQVHEARNGTSHRFPSSFFGENGSRSQSLSGTRDSKTLYSSAAVSQVVAGFPVRNKPASVRSTWFSQTAEWVGTSVVNGRIKINEKILLQHRLGEIRRQSRCVLNPESNRFMMSWDLSSAFLLCCLAVLTPLETGFQKDAEAWSLRWSFNQLINLFFFLDLLLQFNLPYTVPTRYGEKLVFSRSAIVAHYLRTWFLVDLVSMIPFDLITPGKSLGALRAVRLLRLLKLLRLLRGIRIVRRIQTEVGMSFRKIMLGQLFLAVMMAAHWIACFLGLVSRWQVSESEVCLSLSQEDCVLTWMTEGLAITGSSTMSTEGDRFLRTYLTAMHASMSILVHPHHYMPTNVGEQVAFIVLMLAGGFIWTQVISRSTAIFTSLDRHRIFFQQTLDDVNTISYSLGLSPALRRRLRKFFLTANRTSNQEVWKVLVSRVSPQLRRDISREVNKAWVLRIHVLAKCQSTSFVTTIAEQLTSQQFAEGEMFGSPFHLYVLAGGLGRLVSKIHILIKDAVWGEDHLLLTNRNLLSDNAAQAMTFTETMTLRQVDFQAALGDFPEFTRIIRRATVRHVLIRGLRLLVEAEHKRKSHEEHMIARGAPIQARPPSAVELAKQISQFGLEGFQVHQMRISRHVKQGGRLLSDSDDDVKPSGDNEYLQDSFDQIRRLRQTSMRCGGPSARFSTLDGRRGSGIGHQFSELGDLPAVAQLTQSIDSLSEQVRIQGESLRKLSMQQETIMAQQAALTCCLQKLVPDAECWTLLPPEAHLKLPSRLTPRVGRRNRSSPRRPSHSSRNEI